MSLRWAASVHAKFFERLDHSCILLWVLRARTHAEALFDHRLQVNPAPADHTIRLHVGAGLHNRGKLAQLGIAEPAGRAWGPTIKQPFRAPSALNRSTQWRSV